MVGCVFGLNSGTASSSDFSPRSACVVVGNKDGKVIVTGAHNTWARYVGALLFPWETTYWLKKKDGTRTKNPHYGRATINNWRGLVKRVEWMRNWRHAIRRRNPDKETPEQEEERLRINHVAKRKLCIVDLV